MIAGILLTLISLISCFIAGILLTLISLIAAAFSEISDSRAGIY